MGNICSLKKPQVNNINDQQLEHDSYFSPQEVVFYQDKFNNDQPNVKSITSWKPMGHTLGSGSYGNVILGIDNDGSYMAVKQLSLSGYNFQSTDYRIQSFKQEIDLLSKLSHPNIVKYLGMEQTKSHLNIFLEYVSGGSLAGLLAQYGKFKEPLIRCYTFQILLGLEYLHANGVVHRDIKGANVLVDGKGVCKLTDFGCSKQITQIISCKTMVGTMNFMAPEVIQQDNYGRFADIWSVGCTIIEMATGKAPWFDLMNREYMQTLFKIGKEKQSPPLPSELSKDAQDFLKCCFQKEPKDRSNVKQLLAHKFITDLFTNVSYSEDPSVSQHLKVLLLNDRSKQSARQNK